MRTRCNGWKSSVGPKKERSSCVEANTIFPFTQNKSAVLVRLTVKIAIIIRIYNHAHIICSDLAVFEHEIRLFNKLVKITHLLDASIEEIFLLKSNKQAYVI